MKLTEKQYQELAAKIGVEKMKAVEDASGVSTGLLDSTDQPSKSKKKSKNSKVNVSVDCTKEELLKSMLEQGCNLGDYKIVKYGEPDYVLFDLQETKAQMEQIISLYEQLTDYQTRSFDIALKIGEILFYLKENHIENGMLGLWMKQNLPFSVRTGQRYMKIYLYREDLAKKGITTLNDAYLEINGDPLDEENIETDDGTNTEGKMEITSTTSEVDNIKLPKKKLKGLEETVQITLEIVERMEQSRCPFDQKYVKIVATIPPNDKQKSLLSRFVIAAGNLLVPGGKLIFVKK